MLLDPNRDEAKLPLTLSDKRLITFLFESRISTQDQVRRDVFHDLSDSLIFRRLRKLERLGIVVRHGLLGSRGKLIGHYHLTRAGLNFVLGRASNEGGCRIKSESPIHDRSLVDLRRAFSGRERVVEYLTENALLAGKNYHGHSTLPPFAEIGSDAAILFQDTSTEKYWLPVELEMSMKNLERCEEKIARYHSISEIPLILLICGHENVLHRYQEIEERDVVKREPRVFMAMLSDVLGGTKSITFKNVKGQTLKFEKA